MLLDWLAFGLLVFGVTWLLNATVFKAKPASPSAAWGLTIAVFFLNLAALSIIKDLRYKAISDKVGGTIFPDNPIDWVGALVFTILFFSFLRREQKKQIYASSQQEDSTKPELKTLTQITPHGTNQPITQPHSIKPKGFKYLLLGGVLIGALVAIILILLSGRGPEGARTKLAELNIPLNEQVFFERINAGDVFVVGLFLDAGVSPNLKDKEGYPALIRAAQRGHSSIIKILLKHGAEVNITQTNITALDIAEIREHQEISKILRSAGGLTAMGVLDRQYPIAPVQQKPEVLQPKPPQTLTYPNLPELPTIPPFESLTMEERENRRASDFLYEKMDRERAIKK